MVVGGCHYCNAYTHQAHPRDGTKRASEQRRPNMETEMEQKGGATMTHNAIYNVSGTPLSLSVCVKEGSSFKEEGVSSYRGDRSYETRDTNISHIHPITTDSRLLFLSCSFVPPPPYCKLLQVT